MAPHRDSCLFSSVPFGASSHLGGVLPKQRLFEQRAGHSPLPHSAKQSNQQWISATFVTPDMRFNLIMQPLAFPSPLVVTHYPSPSYSPHFHHTWSSASSILFTSTTILHSLTVTLPSSSLRHTLTAIMLFSPALWHICSYLSSFSLSSVGAHPYKALSDTSASVLESWRGLGHLGATTSEKHLLPAPVVPQKW